MMLSEIVKIVEEASSTIDVDFLTEYGFDDYMMSAIKSKPYYKCLPAYIKNFGIQSVLEFGTCSGASSLCMSQYAQKVKTIDITDQFLVRNNIFDDTNIVFINAHTPALVLDTCVKNFDMIFIDISHSGHEEKSLHFKLENEYNGLAFYDDIRLNQEMIDFWNSIKQDKIETNWHNQYGFGIVRY